jgi:hypothetical protein
MAMTMLGIWIRETLIQLPSVVCLFDFCIWTVGGLVYCIEIVYVLGAIMQHDMCMSLCSVQAWIFVVVLHVLDFSVRRHRCPRY